MATQEKTWNVANRLHSMKDSDKPEVNHIIAGADEIYDDTKGAKQSDINAQTDAALADRYTKSETYSKEQLDSLITTPDANYVTVATFADLPQTGEANTIYRVSSYDGTQVDASKYALYAWNGATYQLLAVRSAVGEVFDVSEYNSGATYETLTAALAAVPASVQRGGMSIKFILRTNTGTEEEPVYHDEYVLYRLMNTDWSSVAGDWQGVDSELIAGSRNLVESGVVHNELALGAVYDVSAKNPTAGPNNDGKFESLSAILSDANLNTLIPTAYRKGGMSIKFVQSSDNKYVQYRLMSDSFNTTPSNWQGVDDEPTAGSNNLVKSGGVNNRLLNLDIYLKSFSDVKQPGFIGSVGQWNANDGSGFCIPTADISQISIRKLSGNGPIYAAYLKENVYKTGVLSYAGSWTSRFELEAHPIIDIADIPEDCKYIWICTATGSAQYSVAPADFECIINDIDVNGNYYKHLASIKKLILDNNFLTYNFNLVGQGATQVKVNLPKFKANRAYKITGIGWSYTASTQSKIFIYGVKTGIGITSIFNVPYNDTSNSAIFNPSVDDFDYFYLVARLNEGDTANVVISDVNEVVIEKERALSVEGNLQTDINNLLNNIAICRYHIVGQGAIQVTKKLPYLSKGNSYILSGIGWSYTASTQSKIFVYGFYSETPTRPTPLLTLAYNDTRNVVSFKVPNQYNFDWFEIYIRMNEGEVSDILLSDSVLSGSICSSIGYAIPIGSDNFVYDSSTKTLTLPSEFDVVGEGGSGRVIYEGQPITFVNKGAREQVLVFDWATKLLSTENGDYNGHINLDGKYIILGTVDIITGKEYFNFPYLKNAISNDDRMSVVDLAAHAAYGKDVELRSFITDYFDSLYWNSEEPVYNAFEVKIRARKTTGICQMAFITDTHEGGQYAENNMFAFRTITLFNRLAQYVDICAHGGDISCDYDTSIERYFAYMQEVMKLFRIGSKNFLITKGNHDQRDKGYSEISPLKINWNIGSYYVSTGFGSFTQVTKDTYRGGQLYVSDPNYMTDSLFRFIQSQNVPATAVWGNGAYYFYDNSNFKIRFIVGNDFPVKDSGVLDRTEEYIWFMQTALDFSKKDTPSDWLVVMLNHTESTSNSDFNAIVSAFMNGTSVTKFNITVDYGALNNGGIRFLHIHGHEHGSAGYSNMPGYIDLGFVNGGVDKSNLGDASKYPVYLLNIDTVNNKLIVDCLKGNTTYTYDLIDNILELQIGQSILMARSGLSSQSAATWVSSDSNIASVGEHTGVVTGISAGIVTITGTEGTKVRTYTLKVVS